MTQAYLWMYNQTQPQAVKSGFGSSFFNILYVSLYINPYWEAGTDESSNLASALLSLHRCHIWDYSSPLSNKSLTMPGP